MVQGPTAIGEDAGFHTEVGKFILFGGKSVSELERNDFLPALFLHKDTKGAVTCHAEDSPCWVVSR